MYRLERSKAPGAMPLTRSLMAMPRIRIWTVVHCRNGRAAVFWGSARLQSDFLASGRWRRSRWCRRFLPSPAQTRAQARSVVEHSLDHRVVGRETHFSRYCSGVRPYFAIRWRLRDLNFSPSSRQMMKSAVTDFLIGTAGRCSSTAGSA